MTEPNEENIPNGGGTETPLLKQIEAAAATMRSLLAKVGAAAPPRAPVRFDQHPDGTLRVWYENRELKVQTLGGCPAYDEIPVVYLNQVGFGLSYDPDWSSLTPTEARELAQALIAAADDADAHPGFRAPASTRSGS